MSLRTLALGILLLVLPSLAAGGSVKYGKATLPSPSPNNIYCRPVSFPQSFSGSGAVRVLASVSHGDESSIVHDSAVVWTKKVTAQSFELCMMESGEGTNGTGVVNWLAFQATPSGALAGTASVGLFTSSTKCTRVNFAQRFLVLPEVLAAVRHGSSSRAQAPLNLWLEDVDADYFRICLREVKTFDGKHEHVQVDWLAFTSAADGFTYTGDIRFDNTRAPLKEDGFAYCRVENFTEEFYAPPVVILTANHAYDSKNSYSVKPENNIINTWAEEITNTTFRVCMKDKAGDNSQHDPVNVDYLALGDLDPCINVSCDYFAVCRAFGPNDARCVCVDDCPSYVEPVCSSNGTTYDNECVFEREMCHTQENFTVYHPGMCTGFPSVKGRHRVRRSSSRAETSCDVVSLSPYVFYPDRPIHVLATVNHVNDTDPNFVHDAVVHWVEDVDELNFTVCVTEAGRNERKSGDFATIDWLAFQGAPNGGVSGRVDMDTWWTGTSCKTVNLPSGKFRSAPVVQLTAEHQQLGVKHDASSAWLEDVTSSSFKVCVRELQNFDGAHEKIHIDWIAFEELHRPLFRERGSTLFKNGHAPSKDFNFAFCKDINFTKPYNQTPNVLLTANHSTNGGNLQPEYNSISAWLEFISKTGFRACAKELHVKKHDPLSVSYAVLPDVCGVGWDYFNGSCYFTSKECQTWTNASSQCRRMDANLVTVRSQEENVFIQHRQNGATSWIGLNDIASEGVFAWVDGCPEKVRFWADNQPNDLHGNQDCVHTLGISHEYKWNDVQCSECHSYTCEKDYDECISSPCLNGGRCTNKLNDFECACTSRYRGKRCEENKRCTSGPCRNGGTCTEGVNSYSCSCPGAYYGSQCQGNSWTESSILHGHPDYMEKLSEYTRPVEVSGKPWKRCFKASDNSYSSHAFHYACNNKGPTVTIVRVGSYVFGGYTDKSWTTISKYAYSTSSFLFSLKNPRNQQYKMLEYRYQHNAIYGGSSYGPIFGGGHDLILYHSCHSNTHSYTNLGHTYREPTGHGYTSSQARSLLAGSYHFRCDDYEVFYQA